MCHLPLVDDLAVLGAGVSGEGHGRAGFGKARCRLERQLHLLGGTPAPRVDERAVLEADQACLDQAGVVCPDGRDQLGPPSEELLEVGWVVNAVAMDPDVCHVASLSKSLPGYQTTRASSAGRS